MSYVPYLRKAPYQLFHGTMLLEDAAVPVTGNPETTGSGYSDEKENAMENSTFKSIIIGMAMSALAVAGVVGYRALKPTSADVVAVKEITQTVETPRKECKNVQVRQQAPTSDPNRIAGTAIGGVAGGILGNQIGRGGGNAVATILGAAGGAYVGNQLQGSMQKNDVITTTKRRCTTVYDTSQQVVGYDVTYRLKGKEEVVRTAYRPGATLPVEHGQVVVTSPTATQ